MIVTGHERNCIEFAYHKLGLPLKKDAVYDSLTIADLKEDFKAVPKEQADALAIIGRWYDEISVVHMAVTTEGEMYEHIPGLGGQPALVADGDIKPDGLHSAAAHRCYPHADEFLSLPEKKVYLKLKQ